MKVEVFEESSVTKRLEIEVEKEAVDSEFSRAYRELAARTRVKGFRPGKVPVQVIKQQFGPKVQGDVLNRLLSASLSQAVRENQIPVVGTPSVTQVSLNPGEPLKYTAKVEIKPEIKLNNMKLGEIEKEKSNIDDKEVETRLNGLQRRHSQIKSRSEDEASISGDILTIDFLGKIDGVPFDGGAAKDANIELGSQTFIPGFEEQLTGVKRGATEVKVTFPEDYARKELAGKEAIFDVTVKDIRQRIIPALDDEFAKDAGEFETLQQLKDKIADELLVEARDRADGKFKEALLRAAIEKNPFEVPPSMIERHIDFTIEQTNQRLRAQGVDFRKFEVDMAKLREELRDRSRFQVAASLLIDAVGKQENITVSEDDLNAHYEKLASAANEPVAKVAAYFRTPERVEPLRFELLQEKVLDLLSSKATIVEVEPKPESETDSASEESQPKSEA
jgi:trigger factor